MADLRKFSNTSNLVRFVLVNSSTGVSLTGLAFGSSGLIIGTICDDEATTTAYTAGGSTIETITTLGTFAAPTATKCRFKEVDATNHPGLYEFQFADARFAISSAKRMVVTVSGAASLLTANYEIALVQFDPYDAVRLGLTALPNTAVTTNASLLTSGTGTDQLSVTSGRIDVGKALGTAVTLDANNVLNVSAKYWAGTAITATSIPVATAAGASGGLFIAGTNAATTVTTAFTTTFTGNLTGSAGSVTGAVGSVTGSVASVTGAVGSVTGNVGGNVVGSVASVTARVTANADQLAGQTVTAAAGVTFPTSVASPTNITAATGVVLSGVTHTGAVIPRVTLTDTLTTYTGNTVQTGDAYARIGAAGAGLTAVVAASVTAAVTLDKTQALSAARDVSAIADTSLTVNDALHCAIAAAAGKETVVSTTYTVKTPSTGTTLRIFTLDSATAPTSRT